MLPLRDCRGYRSRYINALNRAVRSLTPIAGRGIRLRQSAQGVVIEATAKGGGAKASPFRHRWQVTATREVEPDGSASWTVNIRTGSVWTAAEDGAVADAALTPVAPVAPDAENGGWKVEGATSGSLYVALDDAGAHLLKYGDPAAETAAVILRIADVAFTTGDPPSAVITQRQVGDERIGSGGSAATDPAAWMIRRHAFTETNTSGEEITTHKWQVFSPLWCAGRQTLLPDGMGRGWNDLPDGADSDTLYAALTWIGTATKDADGNETVTWTPEKPILTNTLADIPPDDDPTGAGTSSATPGHRSVIVEIGDFEDAEDAGDGEDAPTTDFRQAHLGVIVEDVAEGEGGGDVAATVEEAPPASFEVRKIDGVWKIWEPRLTLGNETILDSTTRGWLTLSTSGGNRYLLYVVRLLGSIKQGFKEPSIITWKFFNASLVATTKSGSEYNVYARAPENRYDTPQKQVVVEIGKWQEDGTFHQFHTGAIVVGVREDANSQTDYTYREEELLHENVPLPTAFAITEDGKLEISTRNAKIPIALNENADKILLDLPAGGGNGDTLGPIEWDASRSAYVQYIGKWTWSGSAWVFERKKQASGTEYPPAKVYPVTAADLLIRGRGGSSGTALTDDIKTLRFNLPFAAATATNWLTKQETTVSNGVTYEPPEDAGGNGELKTGTFTLTYWSDTTPGRPSNSTLIYTVVETANATSTYEG